MPERLRQGIIRKGYLYITGMESERNAGSDEMVLSSLIVDEVFESALLHDFKIHCLYIVLP